MRLAVLANAHGNLLAFQAVLADLHAASPDLVGNLGDIATGPFDPAGSGRLQLEPCGPASRCQRPARSCALNRDQPGVTIKVFLLRHGETEWNAVGRFQGQLDSPLTTRGREQAARLSCILARALAGRTYPPMHVSPLGRTRDTADISYEFRLISLVEPAWAANEGWCAGV